MTPTNWLNGSRGSIAGRLLAGYAAVILLLGLTWAAGAYSIGQINGRLTHTDQVNDTLLDNVVTRIKLLDDEETGLRGYLLTGQPQFLAPYTRARQLLPGLRRQGSILVRDLPSTRPLLLTLQGRAIAWELWAQDVLRHPPADPRAPAAIAQQIEGKGLFDQFRAASAAVIQSLNAGRERDLAESRRIASALNLLSAAIFIAALLATLIIGWRTMRAIVRPLTSLRRAAQGIGDGDLSRTVEVVGAREFAALGRSMDHMRRQLARANAALEHRALHDALTGLPNRVLFQDRLGQAIRTAQRGTAAMALLLMDLDCFKEVNDALGHEAGDILLQEVARRLQAALRASDTVARLGGDEFAIVLPGVDAERAAGIAEKLCHVLEAPLTLTGASITVRASIGIAVYPPHGEDGSTLLRHADVAMYAAKRSGTGYATYSDEYDRAGAAHLAPSRESVASHHRS